MNEKKRQMKTLSVSWKQKKKRKKWRNNKWKRKRKERIKEGSLTKPVGFTLFDEKNEY